VNAARAIVVLLAAAALACASPCSAAPAPDDPRAIAASVAHELRVQDSLPGDPSRTQTRGNAEGSAGTPSAPPPSVHPGTLSPALGWIALAFAAVFLAAMVFDAFASRRRSSALAKLTASEGVATPGAPRSALQVSLASADELAAAGRYTEAIHQLLSDAVAMLRRRVGPELSDALTSREIVRTLRLPDAERSALGEMVRRVEHTWFAQRVAAREDYDAVRASFRVFTPGAGAA
jgi:hypothetical protein